MQFPRAVILVTSLVLLFPNGNLSGAPVPSKKQPGLVASSGTNSSPNRNPGPAKLILKGLGDVGSRLKNLSLAEKKRVHHLDLSYSGLSDIGALEGVINLENLRLADSAIPGKPGFFAWLKQQKRLKQLDLSGQDLRKVGPRSVTNPALEELVLSQARFQHFGFLGKLPRLRKLDLSGARFSTWKYFYRLNSVHWLNFSGQSGISFKDFHKHCRGLRLTRLLAAENSWAGHLEIPVTPDWSGLEFLNLRGNGITQLEGLEQFQFLRGLDVRDNQMRTLPNFKKHFPWLLWLGLEQSGIPTTQQKQILKARPGLFIE